MVLRKSCLLFLLFFLFVNLQAQESSDQQLASYYYQNKEYEKAILYYKKLYIAEPSDVFFDALLNCYINTEQYKQAEKLAKQHLKNQKTLSAKLSLAKVYSASSNQKKEQALYQSLYDDLGENPTEIIQLNEELKSLQQYDVALKVLEKADQKLKGSYPFNTYKAELYELKKDYSSMIDEYLNLLEVNENYISQVQASLASSDGFEKNSPQSTILKEKLLKKVQKKPNQIMYSELLIWILLKEKNYNMAFIQSKALDKRFKEKGDRMVEFAQMAIENKQYDYAIKTYNYLLEKGEQSPYYNYANRKLLSAYKQKITTQRGVSLEEIQQLKIKYLELIESNRLNRSKRAQAIQELAEIEAKYLNQSALAIDRLGALINQSGLAADFKARCKIDMADYMIFEDRIWDAALNYAQVEKAFKYDKIGEQAKLKSAKVAYYTGEFKWAKAQLDVLKGSTSKLIANDAMWLSVIITDNMTKDSTHKALKLFSKADLLIHQHKYKQAIQCLDSILIIDAEHPLRDDIYFKRYELDYLQKNYVQAAAYLQKIVDDHSEDILADNALFKLAELNENQLLAPDKAADLYFKLLESYPSSVLGVEARKRFRTLQEKIN